MATSYQVFAVYDFRSYGGGTGFFANPGLFLIGATALSPAGSNLPAPAPVGRYGAFNQGLFIGGASPTQSKQAPVRIGPRHAFVTLAVINVLGGAGALRPAYGN